MYEIDTYIDVNNHGKIKLHAYEIKNDIKANVWAIVIHGYKSQGIEMTEYAKHFIKENITY